MSTIALMSPKCVWASLVFPLILSLLCEKALATRSLFSSASCCGCLRLFFSHFSAFGRRKGGVGHICPDRVQGEVRVVPPRVERRDERSRGAAAGRGRRAPIHQGRWRRRRATAGWTRRRRRRRQSATRRSRRKRRRRDATRLSSWRRSRRWAATTAAHDERRRTRRKQR